MRKFILVILFFASSSAFAIEIRVWPDDSKLNNLTDSVINEKIENGELEHHPCGLVQIQDVLTLPPPDSTDSIYDVESVYEFDENGTIINQWSIPVDSEVFAIKGADIFVGWQKGIALKISRTGEIAKSEQKYLEADLIKCPDMMKDIFVGSDYITCTVHKDLKSGAIRSLSYEALCT